ncbi:uncharacterized protein LOC114517404 [Dendronephthya gigantea]|uniref:uncharacterized protein LOC114517404 n=1 Tax=Dendronephthya gigantea TaxID=151771 RepID=UPI00106DB05C|nr:uncharacterized protein LOC114517404 [Dendronephthya gigantea]XP_028392903.1 uncharacterized protein LOC114517404 [Dendronephthya gigantea]
MVPKIRVSLARRNASKRERLVTGFVLMSVMIILWTEGTSGSLQPNLTSVETWGETQIKVTWEPFHLVESDEPHFYELYIDEHLEYFGNDVIYIARRLTPDTIYHFKLRSCVQNNQVCSLFSKILSGTTAPSGKSGFTKSSIKWTLLVVGVTILTFITSLLGLKITRRLWRSFLYRYDYGSETNLQLPKYSASTGTLDEDLVPSLCLAKTDDPGKNGEKQVSLAEDADSDHSRTREPEDNHTGGALSEDISLRKYSQHLKGTSAIESRCDVLTDDEGKSQSNSCNYTENGPKIYLEKETQLSCNEKTENDHFKLQRAHTSPTLNISKDLTSKHKNKSHRRTRSFDDKKQQLILLEPKNRKSFENIASQDNSWTNVKHSNDLVIVVDNSNVFIGAQECAVRHNPNERKRNIRVKIQQLVKVFQRERMVSRAFVQGSSPPMTEQVWQVYRRLGYCVDVEDRRGKDEQRVDEGLHLHIYKALLELSPRTLVIASGDGNKGKSECSTSLPGCAEAALGRNWRVEVHSWQHSTSMEWVKLSRKYPKQLTIHYLDRYINNITFVDGKYGRKCLPFQPEVLKSSSENH